MNDTEPPPRAGLGMEEQLLNSMLLPVNQAPHTLPEGAPNHPEEETPLRRSCLILYFIVHSS